MDREEHVPLEHHIALMSDSTAWVKTGLQLLDSADLIWATVVRGIHMFGILCEIAEASPDHRYEESLEQRRMVLEGIAMGGPFRLLAGYAIENLLKAVHVRRRVLKNEPIVNDQGNLQGIRGDHNYVELAKRELGETISPEEELLLCRLSLAVLWAGRYPGNKKVPGQTDWIQAYGSGRDDRDQVRALADRIIRVHDGLG